jgi:transglutaminase-like putative cysteine protease
VLDLGFGVCQDQAHVRRLPPGCRHSCPLRERLCLHGETGEVASHAWVDAWIGGNDGWLSLDVTHGEAAGAAHCRLAVGRDYLDAAPVRGVRRGGGREQLSVAVKLAEFGAAPAAQAVSHQQQ